jgi:hypothetical protein
MSHASDYGVAVIESRDRQFGIYGGLNYEDRVTVAGDQIAYWLHWVEANVSVADTEDDPVSEAISNAMRHWEAERGEGDDIANDDSYLRMINSLP